MDLLDYLRRQFAYDEWANREVLAALRSGGTKSKSLQLLSHILSAEQLWLERLTEKPQTTPVWPDFTADQCEAQIGEMAAHWHEYLAKLTPAGLARTISYKNSKGEPWTSAVQDVLTHVLMHSAYHRGQMAREMRSNGQTPAYTDFIHCVRKGLIE